MTKVEIEHQSADMVAFRAIDSTCCDVYCSDSIFAYSLKSADVDFGLAQLEMAKIKCTIDTL